MFIYCQRVSELSAVEYKYRADVGTFYPPVLVESRSKRPGVPVVVANWKRKCTLSITVFVLRYLHSSGPCHSPPLSRQTGTTMIWLLGRHFKVLAGSHSPRGVDRICPIKLPYNPYRDAGDVQVGDGSKERKTNSSPSSSGVFRSDGPGASSTVSLRFTGPTEATLTGHRSVGRSASP